MIESVKHKLTEEEASKRDIQNTNDGIDLVLIDQQNVGKRSLHLMTS
jgi:tRNA U34 5-carboxymethylaminomethyl modifying GTPase MnmE/TrmE